MLGVTRGGSRWKGTLEAFPDPYAPRAGRRVQLPALFWKVDTGGPVARLESGAGA